MATGVARCKTRAVASEALSLSALPRAAIGAKSPFLPGLWIVGAASLRASSTEMPVEPAGNPSSKSWEKSFPRKSSLGSGLG